MCKGQGTCFVLVKTEPVTRIMCFYLTCLNEASITSLTKHLAKQFFACEGNADKIIYLILSSTVRYQS